MFGEKKMGKYIILTQFLLLIIFIFALVIGFVVSVEVSSPCHNNCFCDVTQHYGKKCELSCDFSKKMNNSIKFKKNV